MAVAGMGKLHDSCKDNQTTRICESGLQSQWWSVVLQGLVLGAVGFLAYESCLRKWRFPLVGFLAIVSVRLMVDIEIGWSPSIRRCVQRLKHTTTNTKMVPIKMNRSGVINLWETTCCKRESIRVISIWPGVWWPACKPMEIWKWARCGGIHWRVDHFDNGEFFDGDRHRHR